MKIQVLQEAYERALGGVGLTIDEAAAFAASPDSEIYSILAITEYIRRRYKGTEINLCSIVNAKSGLCREDCTFCSQSVKYSTGAPEYPMQSAKYLVDAAKNAAVNGAREFSIVTSGTKIEKSGDVDTLIGAITEMKENVGMERCASLGILTRETLKKLKDAGLQSYHHNLETGRSFFPKVCSTHAYDEDVAVVRAAKELGLHTCCGGIFGLGEAWDDRIELIETLRELDVDSVPINFLNPRPGTPLENSANLTPIECLKIIALMRLMLPQKDIVVCGGRNVNLRDLQPLIFAAGANGVMIGNYLTTPGRDVKDDLQMIKDLGLELRGL